MLLDTAGRRRGRRFASRLEGAAALGAICLSEDAIARSRRVSTSRSAISARVGGMAGTARVNPDYSLEYRRKVLPYKNHADFELMIDGLRKAGIVQ